MNSLFIARGSVRISFDYTNHRGVVGRRRAELPRISWGSTEWHPEPQWLASMFDLDKREWRDFAIRDMSNIQSEEPT